MKTKEIDRIENAMHHIDSAIDVDPWAMDIAFQAMRKRIPQKPKDEPEDSPLHYKYCPLCHRKLTMNDWKMPYCKMCGQAIDWSNEDAD